MEYKKKIVLSTIKVRITCGIQIAFINKKKTLSSKRIDYSGK